jgi:hypothetical protein
MSELHFTLHPLQVTLCVLKKDDPTIKKLERSKSEQLFEAMRKDVRFLQAQGHNRILRVIEVHVRYMPWGILRCTCL